MSCEIGEKCHRKIVCYVRHMDIMPYQELMCLTGVRGFQKEERMWKMMNNQPIHLDGSHFQSVEDIHKKMAKLLESIFTK
jgi:hypothetical protein